MNACPRRQESLDQSIHLLEVSGDHHHQQMADESLHGVNEEIDQNGNIQAPDKGRSCRCCRCTIL